MGKFPYDIPDWNKWKVEDVPELKEIQDRLARRGLRDPWLRNEVWRYQHYMPGVPWYKIIFKGFKWGAGAFVIAVGIEKLLRKEDSHDHGSGHH
ncbi:NADH dehydrogenase [ubiquinone] 1 beta subcomplex subunit 3-like [Acanthaster planci]|uniref:NADH dehydrogenase [ubiquinone] 1 beta subcomplex subunit 3 n=1 Tax=Acanthaster planci TaxID=133434 RepID=A0A8B7ZM60_ACAPL|nr:NADH dehydrogenase [ubiquinone] 1 beta subcomplex subunit 3-like [Acanthaster planci]